MRCRILLVFFSFLAVGFAAKPEVSALANSHESYRALRDLALEESFDVSELELRRDVGLFRLTGKIAFGPAVEGRVALGVFTGRGQLILESGLPHEQQIILLHSGESSVQEEFGAAVLWFTDDTYDQVRESGTAGSLDPKATGELERVRSRLRERRERPRSSLEAMLQGEDMDNIEAFVLADLLNPARRGAFNAYLHGNKRDDLRFFMRPRGAMRQYTSPEETALVRFHPQHDDEGVWYLSHLDSETAAGTASSHEVKEQIDATHYVMDVTIGGNKHLDATARVSFQATESGERVLAFGLLPDLRVTSVKQDGQEIAYIQESEREDGSFFVILPEAVEKGKDYELEIAYVGDEVIRGAGNGNFSVSARSSWYPNLGAFKDPATFDLTFRYPKRFTLVSVGKRVGEVESSKEGNVSRWRSEQPLTVAGFNYGEYNSQELHDDKLDYHIISYSANRPPPALAGRSSPKKMAGRIMTESRVSMQIFSHYFGPLEYGRLALTQQPEFSFGQSWPTLVYLPASAYMDATQRFQLMGSAAFDFADFIREITPHEVAHQWWGHAVSWASYHDQWLSEGLADFSAALFLQATRKTPDDYHEHIRHWRDSILEKNRFGFSPNDVGPLWMGLRLRTPKTSSAYRKLVYPKGGYVIHMLRQMMYSRDDGDARFIAMMKDFVQTHRYQAASTESFQKVVEKHMAPNMDLDEDGGMDWFFEQFVYGTDVPSYELEYDLSPADGGGTLLTAKITQSGVRDDFKMLVPLYLRYGDRAQILGSAAILGSNTVEGIQVKLAEKPDEVLLCANHDILAHKVETKK